MSVPAFDAVVADLQGRLGSALLAVDVWDPATALALSGLDNRPATGPVLHRLVADLRDAAALSGSAVADYIVLGVSGGSVVVVASGTATAAVHVTDEIRQAELVTGVVPAVRAALHAC